MRPGEPQMVQDVKWTITLDRTFHAPCLPLDSHLSCKKQIWQKPHNARRFPSPPFLAHHLASSMIYSLVLFFLVKCLIAYLVVYVRSRNSKKATLSL